MNTSSFVLATMNMDKVSEIQDILNHEKRTFKSLQDFPGTVEVNEDGETLLSNAFKKARAAYQKTGLWSIADDTGLEVDCLHGAPGVHSSRFAGDKVTYKENNEKLLKLMFGVPFEKRTARFRCVAALVNEEEESWVEGVCEGVILTELKGDHGFGYDPLFYVPEKKKTFAQMSSKEKNEISHRGRAFRKMDELLRGLCK